MWNDVNSLKGKLAPLDASSPTDLRDERYCGYFGFYGFQRLQGLYQQYHFGSIHADLQSICTEGALSADTSDGVPIACHWWRVAQSKRTAFILHGLFDHVGLFLPLVDNFLRQGMDVIAIDLPDHGLSALEYGSLKSFTSYSEAVAAVMSSVQIPISGEITLVGQSTGGAVLVDYLSTHDVHKSIDQLVLLAPLLRSKSWFIILASYVLLNYFVRKVPRSFQASSHDDGFCDFLRNKDPLQSDFVSIAWVGAMLDWAKGFSNLSEINLPALLVQGTQDETVDFRFNISQYQKKISGLEVKMIEGARHHLVGEADPWRAQVFESINAFIQKQS